MVVAVLRRLLGGLFAVEVAVGGTAFVAITVLIFADVLAREAFGNGIYGAQRVAVYCMAIAAFLGFAVTTHVGGHLRIELADKLVPAPLENAARRLADLVSAGICLFLAYWTARFVEGSYLNDERGVALGVVVWPIQLVMLWMFASAALRHLLFAAVPGLRPRPDPEA